MSQPLDQERRSLRMIDVTQVATILDISTRTVWRLVSSGELPQTIRFGRNVRWRVSDIEAWIEKRIGIEPQ
jgi:excisionase family DNA binding protein